MLDRLYSFMFYYFCYFICLFLSNINIFDFIFNIFDLDYDYLLFEVIYKLIQLIKLENLLVNNNNQVFILHEEIVVDCVLYTALNLKNE
jgi:hypothetical protein